MAGTGMKDIKRRIKSVESTRQITKAMELVASSKMRRAKERAERTRPQFRLLYETISDIASRNRDLSSPYVKARPVRGSCVVVVAGDRGLAGGYNSNVFKAAQALMDTLKNPMVVPIGRKAAEYFHKRSIPILRLDEKLTSTVEYFGMKQAFQLSQWLCQSYLAGKFDVMYIVYTNFVSALSQQPGSLCMLPISKVATATVSKREILYEPSAVAVFERIVPQYIAGLLYGAVTESFASEQAARRTAMESATDNADEMIEQLGLRYNQARQGAITQEITEIAAGAQAAQ